MKVLRSYLYCLLTFLSISSSLALSKKKYCCLINKLNTITTIVSRGDCSENVVLIHQADIPYTITRPGRYCLAETINIASGQTAITIDFDAVSGNIVSIDLNDYAINGGSGGANGIVGVGTVSGNVFPAGLEIFNGTIASMTEHGIYVPLGLGLLSLDALTIQSCGFTGGPTNGGIVVGNDNQLLIDPVVKNTNIFGSGGTDYGLILINPQDFSIINTSASFNGNDGMSIRGTVDFIPGVIYLCTTSGNRGNGIMISADTSDTKFIDCIAAANGAAGYAVDGDHSSFSNCQATSNGTNGFTIISDNNVFIWCNASGNTQAGFAVNSGTNNDIQSCTALSNGTDGFLMATAPNQINGNTASGNSGDGFNATDASPTGNRIYSNFSNDNGTNFSASITNVAVSPVPADPINFTTNIAN